jgi:ribosomal-protein-alanine N-acetyltransferase
MIFETKFTGTLETERLVLRQRERDDLQAIVRYVGDPRVALKTTTIPHPYNVGHAFGWLDEIETDRATGAVETFAIERKTVPGLIGMIGLICRQDRRSAEVFYWIGVPFWGCGYATEALRETLRHAFADLGLRYVTGGHMIGNPASGKVMQKARMIFEGIVSHGMMRQGVFYDRVNYGISADEWKNATG